MDRESLNLHLNSLLSLSREPEQAREILLEMAYEHDSWEEFIAEWLLSQGCGEEQLLEIKVLLGASYERLARIFGLHYREVAQLLRTQRSQRLGAYPKRGQEAWPSREGPGGLSCFMVEQYLSPWIDGEWESLGVLASIRDHLNRCPSCYKRLQQYRHLQAELLAERMQFPRVSEEEWVAMHLQRKQKRRRRWGFSLLALIGLALLVLFIQWILQKQPERMPNIYELPAT